MIRLVGVIGAVIGVATVPLSAQQPGGTVSGIVRDTAFRGIANADLTVRPGARSARTGSDGRFVISGLPAGKYEVRARAIGYLPVDGSFEIKDGGRVELSLDLTQRFVGLDTVVVSASSECAHQSIQGFACRRKSAHGTFLDFVDIANKNPEQIGDIFRGVDGFRVEYRPGRPSPYSETPAAPIATPLATAGMRCSRSIVNGRMASLANPTPTEPEDIAAMEVYKSPGDVPAYYVQYAWTPATKRTPAAPCSLVVYWTWAGVSSRP